MPGRVGTGVLVLIITFWPSPLMDSYWNMDFARAAFSKVRWIEAAASSPVSLVPLEKQALSLMWKVQVSLSSETVHLSASQGTAFIFLSNLTRHSPRP